MKEQKQIKLPRLIDNFIYRKIDEYEVPTRAGTPRGEPIGYSAKKYYAAVLCLKTVPVKEMAKMTKVSYGLLRKWRTEDDFKKLVEELSVEFTAEVINHLVARGIKQAELADEYVSRSVEEISKTPPPELTWNEFEDLKFYSEKLMATIIFVSMKHFGPLRKEVEKHYSPEGPELPKAKRAIYFQVQSFWDIIRHYPFKKDHRKKHSDIPETKAGLNYKASLIQIAHEWRNDKALSEDTLKLTIFTLHDMAGKFTPMDMDI